MDSLDEQRQGGRKNVEAWLGELSLLQGSIELKLRREVEAVP